MTTRSKPPTATPQMSAAAIRRKHWRVLPCSALLNRTAFLGAAVVVLFAVYVLLGSYTVTIPDFFRILTAT